MANLPRKKDMDYQSKHSGTAIEGILDIVDTSGDGTRFLSDDGTYKEIGPSQPTGETLAINVSSNQALPDPRIVGAKISIKIGDTTTELTYEGDQLTTNIPIGTSYQVISSDVEGYVTPAAQEYVAAQGIRSISLRYDTTLVTFTYTEQSMDNVTYPEASCVLTRDGEEYSTFSIANGGSHTITIPDVTGTSVWKVTFADVTGFETPEDIVVEASGGEKTYTFYYNPMLEEQYAMYIEYKMYDYGDTVGSSTVQRGGNLDVIQRITSKFKRCLALPQADGSAIISYLDEENSDYWPDGTLVDDTVNVNKRLYWMTHFPKYYYRVVPGTNRESVRIYLSDIQVNSNYKEEPECLIGTVTCSVYNFNKGGNRLVSNVGDATESGEGRTIENLYNLAQKNGYNWGLINYRAHRTIANMFVAKYGTTDISTENPNIPCSGGDYVGAGCYFGGGNSDTSQSSICGTSTVFLGIYNCYSSGGEFVQGVNVYEDGADQFHVYDEGLHLDMSASELAAQSVKGARLAAACLNNEVEGYISSISAGIDYTNQAYGTSPEPDVFPMAWLGSSTTGYCDYVTRDKSQKRYNVFIRSGRSTSTSDGTSAKNGVFFCDISHDKSYTDNYLSSRLAFYGTIVEKSKAEFIATPIGWDH